MKQTKTIELIMSKIILLEKDSMISTMIQNFKKIQSGEMKLEKAKKLQCIKSNLNVIQEVEDKNQNSKKWH